jgi:predicted nucleic acid-binding protein
MGLIREHELHVRRRGRNIGVGLVLAAVIAIVFGLTVVKVTVGDVQMQPQQGVSDGN